jgi:hypothetical protein
MERAIDRMRRIDWSGRSPVSILVDQPASGPKTRRHLADGVFLAIAKVEEKKPRADEIESPGVKRSEGVGEDVVLQNFEIRPLDPLQVAEINVGRDHLTRWPDLIREPEGHRSPSRADFEAPPAGLNEVTTLPGARIVEQLQELEPLVLGCLTAGRGEAVIELVFGIAQGCEG